jgi:hypothetical protein
LIFEVIKQIMHRKIKNIVSILRKTKLKLCWIIRFDLGVWFR